MSNKVNPEKYRILPIVALVTGILTYGNEYLVMLAAPIAPFFGYFWSYSLPIAAIVCGSIDLKRIKADLFRNKVLKGMDIAGIVLGSVFILFVTVYMLLGG